VESTLKLCEYTPEDEKECLAIFDSNTLSYFAAQERETFQGFLNRLAAPYSYFVVRDAGAKIVACGGIKLEPSNQLAKLRWDMVSAELHHQSIGTFLTLSRLDRICQFQEIRTTSLHTSQHSYKFYEKMGFIVQHIIPDGIVPGMDEYFMQLNLDEGRRQVISRFVKQASLV
jgi:N-acetylglutamate synthase-like GNAT family acetyltransferase